MDRKTIAYRIECILAWLNLNKAIMIIIRSIKYLGLYAQNI